MMTVKYCPKGVIKKLEIKLWNLKVKGTDVASYTLRFQELTLMCGRMFHEESNEDEKYVGGLPDMIRGNGHFKRDFPKLKNKNRGNQGGNGNASAKVYVVGNAGINPNFNVVMEKIIRIPWGNETLIVHGDESNPGSETCLNIISCTKTQKYMLNGCHVFLAHVTTKETEDKSREKRLEDVPIV
nr:reverse transcriptase domain-containing protein [Tanacetum cinerariifolium]